MTTLLSKDKKNKRRKILKLKQSNQSEKQT